MDPLPDVPFARIAAFVRQHTHNLRNELNGFDLEAAYLQEVASGEEARESVSRLRQQVRAVAEQLVALSRRFNDPQPILAPLPARDLLLIWREQHSDFADRLDVTWLDQLGEERVNVDAGLMATIFRELLQNAVKFSPSGTTTITARSDGNGVLFEMREPKSEPVDTTGWGAVPFVPARRGGYGLGLWTAHRLAEENDAGIEHEFDSGALVTRLRLPTR